MARAIHATLDAFREGDAQSCPASGQPPIKIGIAPQDFCHLTMMLRKVRQEVHAVDCEPRRLIVRGGHSVDLVPLRARDLVAVASSLQETHHEEQGVLGFGFEQRVDHSLHQLGHVVALQVALCLERQVVSQSLLLGDRRVFRDVTERHKLRGLSDSVAWKGASECSDAQVHLHRAARGQQHIHAALAILLAPSSSAASSAAASSAATAAVVALDRRQVV
mmetsp:Transcript_127658/g.408584  ORF Transcript_127658/g.408584 Transcript_127658/m.408584 type:complete len:220 (+) Transcript_127658:3749-4408(+)